MQSCWTDASKLDKECYGGQWELDKSQHAISSKNISSAFLVIFTIVWHGCYNLNSSDTNQFYESTILLSDASKLQHIHTFMSAIRDENNPT